MQTFLPYPSFEQSAACLDRQRLGKQRVETWQILLAITNRSTGWVNHPATKMWNGYTSALINYGLTMCREWRDRGYTDNLAAKFAQVAIEDGLDLDDFTMPPWLGDPEFHASHRSNLLRKDAAHYGQFGWTEADTSEYVWPTISSPLPIKESSMPENENADPTTNVPVVKVPDEPTVYSKAEALIRETVSEVLNSIDPKIGEKNIARATKRLGNIAKNAGIALGRLAKQTKRANRVKRVKKEKPAKADATAPAPAEA